MNITVNNVNITLTPEQIAQICKEAKPEFTYPVFKMSKRHRGIVKFTGLTEGIMVWQGDPEVNLPIGTPIREFTKHTNIATWQDVAYDAERDLWDGQPVYAWDDTDTHSRDIRFYDAVRKCIYSSQGDKGGWKFKNHEAIDPAHYTHWMLEAFTTLQR